MTWFGRMQAAFQREMGWMDAFLLRWLRRLIFAGIHISFIAGVCYVIVLAVAHGRSYDKLADVPARMCGLVLGCAPKVGSRDNLFFTTRIKAAAELYHANKVQFLVVSGNKTGENYNEPDDMKAALVAKGVPASLIYCDYAGFRTLDSIIRAHKIFGQIEFTIISQKFHNERALYMARRTGLDGCVAYNAADAPAESMILMYAREVGARAMAILDVEVLNTKPKVMGEKQTISEKVLRVEKPVEEEK